MHKSKIREIQEALESQSRMVIVGGPTGASKSTVVRLILEDLDRKILEWHAPETSVGDTSLIDSFGDFLVGAALHGPSAVVFVDELPNLLHETTFFGFQKAIEYYLSAKDVPQLIVSFTETEISADYREHIVVTRVFAPFLDRSDVCHIKVNAVNATLMKKVLNHVASEEVPKRTPAVSGAIQALATTGDIRSALIQFELWLRGNAASLPGARDSTTGFFHSIAKIIYGTQSTIEAVVEAHSEDMGSFNLTLLENYTKAHHQRLTLEAATLCSEWQSVADLSQELQPLAIYGVANVVAETEPDPALSKSFQALSFTPLQKSNSERAQAHSKIQTYIARQRRAGDNLSFNEALVQIECLCDDKRNVQLDWSDSDSDSDW